MICETIFDPFVRLVEWLNNRMIEWLNDWTIEWSNDLNLNELIKETEEEIQLPMDQMMTDIENTINYEPKNTKKKWKKLVLEL